MDLPAMGSVDRTDLNLVGRPEMNLVDMVTVDRASVDLSVVALVRRPDVDIVD